uniref:G_PROTEIN_RECEP_F1_2 domain-containing protein n=1 Tax=Bursaphelenchus xylophilus TaxID=6326 RepID=A0A1I7RJQ7_BURXY
MEISTIVHWNYLIALLLGFATLPLLILLIVTQTTLTFKPYSKMLLPCAVADLLFMTVDAIGQIKARLEDGVFLCALEGPGRNLSRSNQILLTVLSVAGFCFVQSSIPVQAYFRFHALKRGSTLSILQTTGLFSLSIVGIVPLTVLMYTAFNTSELLRPEFDYSSLWYKNDTPTVLLVADIRSPYQKLYFLYCAIFITSVYLIAFYYGTQTLATLHDKSRVVSTKTKRIQSQLSMYLFCQGLIPLLTAVGPTLGLVLGQFFNLNLGSLAALCVLCYSWIPFLNGLLTIVVIAPYRNAVCRWIKKPKSRTHSLTTSSSGNGTRSSFSRY